MLTLFFIFQKGMTKMITHVGTKEIKTERLLLRKFRPEDAKAMFETWANDERVTKFLTWTPHGSIEVTEFVIGLWLKDYEKGNSYQWAIEFEGKLIGSIACVSMDENSEHGEIGYCIGYDFWGKGIVTEATKAVIDFLFKEVNLNRIIIEHATKNPASGKVITKCGLTPEGIKREHFKSASGEFLDIASYSILRKEWEKK